MEVAKTQQPVRYNRAIPFHIRPALFSIIDRLLIREVLVTLIALLLVLLMLLMANALVQLLGEVAGGEISLRMMGVYFGTKLVKLLGFLVPPGFFFSILWVLGRMYRNSEMVALQAAGVGLGRLYRPLALLALPLALVVGAITLHYYPAAKAYAARVAEQERASLEIGGLRPGGFTEFDEGRYMVFVGSADAKGETLSDLFVRYRMEGRSGVLTAGRAGIEQRADGRFLVLENGWRYAGVPGTEGFSIGHYARYGIRLPEPKVTAGASDTDTLPLSALLALDTHKTRTELQWRLAAPLSVFALMLVSVPLARSLPRQGVYGRLVLAVVFYALYMNLLRLAQTWMKKAVTPEWLGLWWVPALAVAMAALLVWFDSLPVATRLRRLRERLQ